MYQVKSWQSSALDWLAILKLKTPISRTYLPITRGRGKGFMLFFLLFCFVFLFILFTNPFARAGYDTSSIFKRSLTGLNSEFSFSLTSYLTKAEELCLSYYLPIAGGRIIGFIPFPRVLVLCEMQSVSSRIWTLVAMSISYDDNHYTTFFFFFFFNLFFPRALAQSEMQKVLARNCPCLLKWRLN